MSTDEAHHKMLGEIGQATTEKIMAVMSNAVDEHSADDSSLPVDILTTIITSAAFAIGSLAGNADAASGDTHTMRQVTKALQYTYNRGRKENALEVVDEDGNVVDHEGDGHDPTECPGCQAIYDKVDAVGQEVNDYINAAIKKNELDDGTVANVDVVATLLGVAVALGQNLCNAVIHGFCDEETLDKAVSLILSNYHGKMRDSVAGHA